MMFTRKLNGKGGGGDVTGSSVWWSMPSYVRSRSTSLDAIESSVERCYLGVVEENASSMTRWYTRGASWQIALPCDIIVECDLNLEVIVPFRVFDLHLRPDTTMSTSDIQKLLGEHPSSERIISHLQSIRPLDPTLSSQPPDVKSYPDAVYLNYFSLGLSLLFIPINGYKPKTGLNLEGLKDEDLVLDGVDLYNNPKPKSGAKSSNPAYTTYPVNPFTLNLVPIPNKLRPESLTITPETTGKQFVEAFGEPDRKGGGAGPATGSIGIWCEWSKDGIMVEFGGDESRGPKAWETGKDAVWKVITIFPPKA